MFLTFGTNEVLRNQNILAYPYLDAELTLGSLRLGLWKHLQTIQTLPQDFYSDQLKIIQDEACLTKLLEGFSSMSLLNDKRQSETFAESSASYSEENHTIFNRTLDAFEKINPDLFKVFCNHIYYIFFFGSKTAYGGTSSKSIGTIWVRDLRSLSERDRLEFFVHELTHNLFFVDERVHMHYKDYNDIFDRSAWSLSAILGETRPLDKCLHSIIVATEVLIFRERHLGHPKTTCLVHPDSISMKRKTLEAIEFMQEERGDLVTERAHEILARSKKAIHELQLSSPNRQISAG